MHPAVFLIRARSLARLPPSFGQCLADVPPDRRRNNGAFGRTHAIPGDASRGPENDFSGGDDSVADESGGIRSGSSDDISV